MTQTMVLTARELLQQRALEAFELHTDVLRFTPPDYVAILSAEPLGLGWKTNVFTGIYECFWRDPDGLRWRIQCGLGANTRFSSLAACVDLLGAI